MPTHFDIFVAMLVCFGIGFMALIWTMYVAFQIHKSVKHGERMTRAVAGLVVQESEKIRALMSD
jgi:predicted metal-binding membrane protein